jgi:hypothetical protein
MGKGANTQLAKHKYITAPATVLSTPIIFQVVHSSHQRRAGSCSPQGWWAKISFRPCSSKHNRASTLRIMANNLRQSISTRRVMGSNSNRRMVDPHQLVP